TKHSTKVARVCHILALPSKNQKATRDAVIQQLRHALDMLSLSRRLAESDGRQCLELLLRTQRILEFRGAAERDTQANWNEVCGRLIALPRPKPLRGPLNACGWTIRSVLSWIGLQSK